MKNIINNPKAFETQFGCIIHLISKNDEIKNEIIKNPSTEVNILKRPKMKEIPRSGLNLNNQYGIPSFGTNNVNNAQLTGIDNITTFKSPGNNNVPIVQSPRMNTSANAFPTGTNNVTTFQLPGINYATTGIGTGINNLTSAQPTGINNSYNAQSSIYHPPIVKKNYNPSERLKVLILLAVSQMYSDNDNKIHKVFLINPQWLEFYKYSKIQNIVNDTFQKFQGSNHFWNMAYELNSISTILSQINEDKLKEIDEKINIENQNPFYCVPELLNIQGKDIPLYKSFILINKKLNEHFQKYFSIKPSYEIFHYQKGNEGDYIIIENYPSSNQNYPSLNIILFGIIKKNECKFHIKGIFDYFNNESLNIEKNDLINYYGYSYYSSGRTVLNHHDKKDLMYESPCQSEP